MQKEEEEGTMKIKRIVSALCLAAGLAISVPALSSTLGIANDVATVQAAEQEGWHQDAKGWYFIKDGRRLTNGLQTVNEGSYFFDANGYRVSGTVKIGKYNYYFHPKTGKLCSGYSGLVRIGEDSDVYYYFLNSKKGRVATNTWVKHKGKYYYANATGQVKLGTIKVKGKLYHITPNGRMTSYGKSSYDKKYYNASKNGVLLTGLRKVKGKQYYFDPRTGQRRTGLVKVGKSTFYFTSNGTAKTGWLKDSKGRYYYYLKNYRRAAKWQTINKKRYYFDPSNGCARVTNQWKKIGQYTYYFDKKGVMQTGFFTVGSKTYYASSKGIRKTGWQTVSGRKYYMDPKQGGAVKTGWFQYGTYKYYLNPVKSSTYGAAKTGFVKISGSWYYFDEDTARMKTGWVTENSKKYYFDKKTGKMYTGKHTIDGKTYDFGKSGGLQVAVTGAWSVKVQRGDPNKRVNDGSCFVVVYRGNTPIKAFQCSTAADGQNTPLGTFRIMDKLYWHELNGPTWGQYCSHITSDILFHSVPNLKRNDPYSLEGWEFNKLGHPASGGCIRLSVKHAKWLFENVPVGTKVTVSTNVSKPTNGVQIEKLPGIPASQNYDPTDTFENPYSVR